jgi:hypothetical protein
MARFFYPYFVRNFFLLGVLKNGPFSRLSPWKYQFFYTWKTMLLFHIYPNDTTNFLQPEKNAPFPRLSQRNYHY